MNRTRRPHGIRASGVCARRKPDAGTNINVPIERLVLDGLPVTPGQGPAVQAALEGELARQLWERGMGSVSGGAVPHVSVASIQLPPRRSSRPIGPANRAHIGRWPRARTGTAGRSPASTGALCRDGTARPRILERL